MALKLINNSQVVVTASLRTHYRYRPYLKLSEWHGYVKIRIIVLGLD